MIKQHEADPPFRMARGGRITKAWTTTASGKIIPATVSINGRPHRELPVAFGPGDTLAAHVSMPLAEAFYPPMIEWEEE